MTKREMIRLLNAEKQRCSKNIAARQGSNHPVQMQLINMYGTRMGMAVELLELLYGQQP